MAHIADLILEQARTRPDKPAFVFADGERWAETTYAEFARQAKTAAQRLRGLGCQPGDRVALAANNSPLWCAAYVGIHLAGMTVVPLDAAYTEREVHSICAFVEPAAAIADEAHIDLAPEGLKTLRLEDLAAPDDVGFEPERLSDGQPMSIIFTSGTTGKPKGVMLSEGNILSNIEVALGSGFLKPGGMDRPLLMLPLHHVYACTVTFLTPMCAGCTLVFPRSLKGEDIARAVREQGVTVFPTVPQVLGMLRKRLYEGVRSQPFGRRLVFSALVKLNQALRAVGLNAARWLLRPVHKNFPKLRFFAAGGARLDPEIFHDLRRLGFTVVEAYGLTETSPLVTMNTPRRQVAGSVGRPIPGVDVRIDLPEPDADAGEVCVRGPNVMMGYYKQPEATAEVIRDGWFHTGDLGRFDARGYLFLTGRAKEIIVLPSGKNIYPEELEKHYAAPEAIEEVCVLSLPSPDGEGENLTAVVYPNLAYFRRMKAGNLLQEVKYVIETTAASLPSYQRVTRVELASEPFPRTRLGKLKRFQIREQVLARRGGPAPEEAEAAPPPDDPLLRWVMDALELRAAPNEQSNLETDLGLDSLSKLELISAFEKAFGVRIAEDDAVEILTVGDFRRFLPEDAAAVEGGDAAVSEEDELFEEPTPPLEEHVDAAQGPIKSALRAAGYALMRALLRVGHRRRLEGLENLPAEGPFILAPNHNSYADPVIVLGSLPWRVASWTFSLSLPQIFERFPLSLIRRFGRIILTGTHDTTRRSMQYCAQVLRRGKPMLIFPEGKRSADGLVDRPKRGVGLLAHACAAPLVPIYISGADQLLSRTHPGWRPARVRVRILPPIDPNLPPEEMLDRWFEIMRECEREAAEDR